MVGVAGGMGLWLQHAAVGLLALASAAYLVHARAPRLGRRLRIALAVPMLRDRSPSWLRRIGRWVAPPPATGGRCGACGGCGPAAGP